MKKYIEEHRLLVIIGIVSLIFLIIIVVGFKNMYFSSNGDIYGKRLEGIEKVSIKKETTDKIKKELEDSGKVESSKIRTQGKIVYFTIYYKEDTSIDQAQEIATKTLANFSDEQKSFYDFNYSLTKNKIEEGDPFPTMGTKHPKNSTIAWLNKKS